MQGKKINKKGLFGQKKNQNCTTRCEYDVQP